MTNRVWLIETKLSPPVPNDDLIDRPRVLTALDGISSHKVGFLVAPAGYGKTSLLGQWAQHARGAGLNIAWLSLDRKDRELRQFASYCIAALSRSGISLGQLELAAEQFLAEIPIASVVPRLVAGLSAPEGTTVLILDDYHLADGSDIAEFLMTLISYSPRKLKIIISSRAIPSFGTSSLLATRQAFEVGAETLRFSTDEMRSFAGEAFDATGLQELETETEGWAVAVRLAKLAGPNTRGQQVLPTTEREHIANYLVQQILRHCSDDERRFLLYTSILDQFTPDLAAQLCGRAASNSVLQDSVIVRPLLVRLESAEQWYRYHHLFSELLQGILNSDFPDLVADLHADASRWFEEKGDIGSAVAHAAKAGDIDRAAQLVIDAGGWQLAMYGDISYLKTLVGNFSPDQLHRYPRLRLAYALTLMKDGAIRESAAQLEMIELGRHYQDLTEREKQDYIAVKVHLDIYQDAIFSDAWYQDSAETLAGWPPDNPRGAAVLHAAVAVSATARWQFDTAVEAGNAGVAAMRRANSILGVAYCYVHLGQAAFYQGDLELASAHLQEAAQLAEDNFGADSRLGANCGIVLQSINYWRDHSTLDADLLFSRLKVACEADSWFDIYYTGFSCLMDHCSAVRDINLAHAVVDLSRASCRRRELARLNLLHPLFELSAAVIEGSESRILVAQRKSIEIQSRLEGQFGETANLIPLSEADIILGRLEAATRFTAANMSALDRLIDVAEERSANFFLVRLLVLRARLSTSKRDNQAGIGDILSAAHFAARMAMRSPFTTSDDVLALVRATIRFGREKPENRLEVSFLNDCLANAVTQRQHLAAAQKPLLSAREIDVLGELSVGQSNKEIARVLDMTDHTVKFHLKNIFEKLGVDNRISAINVGRSSGLIH
ncbi:LuxR C-terminal-related transcriptional regulator [Sphingomonas sp. TX0543]|uniref:helix-turn-helix transcriptional regulator n=1 Tax=Sphingomonas sp. TX0543 TaxID=3399682 RepID=UPI003AFB5A8C